MLREALIERGQTMADGFRLRGGSVSRIEGFSDAAFALAVTLLIVSLDVPRTFDDLLGAMRGVPAFAVCFALLIWFWSAHYRFFRRFALDDPLTLVLNSAFLFVVMVYVYPLRFVFALFIGMITGLHPIGADALQQDQVGSLFVLYGAGFIAICVVLAAMNLNALRLRARLGLDALEVALTRGEIARLLGLSAIGLLSIVVACVVPGGAAGLAGFCYAGIGVVEFVAGWKLGKVKEAHEARMALASHPSRPA